MQYCQSAASVSGLAATSSRTIIFLNGLSSRGWSV